MAEPAAVKKGLRCWTNGRIVNYIRLSRDAKEVYLKDYNQLRNTTKHYAGTKNLREAMAHAAFFEKLRQRGVYPPDAGFAVCKSADGRTGVIAVMPAMEQRIITDENRSLHFRKTVAKLLGSREAVHWDLQDENLRQNCGVHPNGKRYFLDLHAVHPDHRHKLMEWYERHLKEKAARGKKTAKEEAHER